MVQIASYTEKILGGKKQMPVPLNSRLSYIQAIELGLTKQNFDSLKTYTGLSVEQLAEIIGITPRTIQRTRSMDHFKASISEKMLELADLYSFGHQVFADKKKFQNWMECPIQSLGNKPPLSLIYSRYGLDLVRDELGRIAYGVYS